MPEWGLPPCADGPDHAVASGTDFCWKCNLVIKPKKTRQRVRRRAAVLSKGSPRPLRRRHGLPDEIGRLTRLYGFERVEEALYEAAPETEETA